jgi:hypothetical protein
MFAEMPLDNRTVDEFAAIAAISGFSGRLKHHRGQNDLMFRHG